jgi:heme-degrading monooxygenase HmoA
VSGDFHLAQVNIAIPKEPPGGPVLAEFMAALDPVNAVADASPGFVWRLQDEDGNATAIRAFDDDTMVNMSVWESLEALRAFVYSNRAHLDVMRRRREWFEDHVDAFQVLWWIPAGHIPSVAEAEDRLRTLRARGPSPEAFTFRRHFPPSTPGDGDGVDDDRWLCPAG